MPGAVGNLIGRCLAIGTQWYRRCNMLVRIARGAGFALLMCGALALDGCGDSESPKNPSNEVAGTAGSSGSASESGASGNGSAGASAGNNSSGTGAASHAGQNNGGGKPAQAGNAGAGTAGAGAGGAAAHFSFFATSVKALRQLSGNEDGFGGDLRFGKPTGLEGADEICRTIAETSMPGNGKTWHAFLSVTKGPEGTPVNAIDRVGDGPWYDRRGRLVTMNKAGIAQTRPEGADPIIADDLPNEDGVPNHDPDGTGEIDNHNFLTGSTAAGQLTGTKLADTCQDWTSAESNGGKPRCGVSWPRAQLINWISVLNEGGCAPGATPPGAQSGTPGTVGALGGYGGFYCFALTP
jgi:hypothetical protein